MRIARQRAQGLTWKQKSSISSIRWRDAVFYEDLGGNLLARSKDIYKRRCVGRCRRYTASCTFYSMSQRIVWRCARRNSHLIVFRLWTFKLAISPMRSQGLRRFDVILASRKSAHQSDFSLFWHANDTAECQWRRPFDTDWGRCWAAQCKLKGRAPLILQRQVYVTGIQYGRSNKKLPDLGLGWKISIEWSILIWDREI